MGESTFIENAFNGTDKVVNICCQKSIAKTLPNSMILDHKPEFIKAFNLLGDQLPVEEMGANIGVRARLKSDWQVF